MSDQFIGNVLAGKYQIEEAIGETDLSTTYRGTHLFMEKPVIIKILTPALAVDADIVRRFSHEAKTASQISHPNILNVTDFNADPSGTVFIVMEPVEGKMLKDALEEKERFPVERAASIVRQTAAGLSAAHSKSVVHGNLSPDKILLTTDAANREIVKIMDIGADVSTEKFSEDEVEADNIAYFAPEQDSQFSEPDARSDIYALGVIFYELLAGEKPFIAESATDLRLKKMEELPAPLSAYRNDLPEGIEPVILKALAKNPEMRQQSAAAFIEELNAATEFSAGQEAFVVPPKAEAAPNNIWKTAFIVLAGISVMAIGLIYATNMKQTDPQSQIQYDANGQPVQPINPATGMNEQGAANMVPMDANSFPESNMMPEVMPGGDGYDAWSRGVQPPPGAPYPVAPGGDVYTIPGNSGSIFMPQEGVILVPVPANTNMNAQPANQKTPKAPPANSQPAQKETPANVSPTPEAKPSPAKTPAASPTAKPRETRQAPAEKPNQSGKTEDSN